MVNFEAGHTIPSETLTMPRKWFGPRPVTIFPVTANAMYAALVGELRTDLPPESRSSENWLGHQSFGGTQSENDADYLVEFDIASCYEYIDHATLQAELLRIIHEVHLV